MRHPIYLEDYIVALCDLSDISTPGITADNMIRLSKQDRSPVRRLTYQVKTKRLGLTASQVDLIKILTKKYRKQLAKWNIDATLALNAPILMPIREIERFKTLELRDNELWMRFNFNKDFIKLLESFSAQQGRFLWNPGLNSWIIYPSEANVKFAVEFARSNDFKITDEVISLYNLLTEFEKTHCILDFIPALTHEGNLINASEELQEYIQSKNFTYYEMCNTAWLNGYQITSEAETRLASELKRFGDDADILLQLIICRYTELDSNDFLRVAQKYCELTNSGPIILILKRSINLKPNTLDELMKRSDPVGKDEILYLKTEEILGEDLSIAENHLTGECALPIKDALVISDIDSGYWYWFNLTLNKIWNLKKSDESTATNKR